MTVISIPTNILKAVAVAMGRKARFVGSPGFDFLLVDFDHFFVGVDELLFRFELGDYFALDFDWWYGN